MTESAFIEELNSNSKYEHRRTVSNIYSIIKKTLFIIGSTCIVFIALSNSLSYQLQRFWGASGNFWQHQWDKILSYTNNDAYTMNVYGSIIVTYCVYWTVGLLYTFLDLTGQPSFLYKYKIQPGTNESFSKRALLKVIGVVHFNQLIINTIIGHLFFNVFVLRGCDQSRTLPTFHWVIFELIIFILVEEIGFYYAHRMFHHRLFYKSIHKFHHDWQSPISLTSVYAHPIEHVLANILPIYAGPLIMGSHVATTYLWYSLAILSTLNSHSGYHLPFFPSPEAHDFHHLKFNQCYGVLGILDFLHGTDEKFRASKQFQRHIMMLSFTPPRVEFPDEDPNQKVKAC